MGSLHFSSSVRDSLFSGWFPNFVQTSSLSRGSGAFAGSEGKAYWGASPISAASQQSWQDFGVIRLFFIGSIGNGPVQGSRPRRASSLGGAVAALSLSKKGARRGILEWNFVAGNYTARFGPRHSSLSDLNDIDCGAIGGTPKNIGPSSLPRRWCTPKYRVRCAARSEEDGGREPRSQFWEAGVVNHYKVLGLDRHATASAIKSAFRQLARQFHPDVNKEVDANEKFKAVRLAYEVLADETSRKLYDRTLQERANASRRNQARQRQERDSSAHSSHYRSHFSRVPYENVEWGHTRYAYESDYPEMKSYYYTYPSSTFSSNKKKRVRNSTRSKFRGEDFRQRDWAIEWQSMFKEAVLFMWVVTALWHTFGAGIALGLLVSSSALWTDFAVGYRLASGVAWLVGGVPGLALMVIIIATTRIFGNAYHIDAAILALGLVVGVGILKAVPLPHGAILLLAYKCIKLQSPSS